MKNIINRLKNVLEHSDGSESYKVDDIIKELNNMKDLYVIKVRDLEKYVSFNDDLGYYIDRIPFTMSKEGSISAYKSIAPDNSDFCEDENLDYEDLEIKEVNLISL